MVSTVQHGSQGVVTMVSRRRYLQTIAAVGSVTATGSVSELAAGATGELSELVGRDGAQLVVGGEPFYFNGANAPWLTHTYPSEDTVDQVMAFASDLGLDVLRTGIHSVDVEGTVHSPRPGELGEEAFHHVDYVLQEADRHGIRMVFSLVDNWDYYGGMDAYVGRSTTASTHDDFYTDDQCREWYRTYVRKVLTRENTLTGRDYRDDPAILMWELANEAEAKDAGVDALQAWKEEMAAHFKQIDSAHLLSTGSGGNYNTDSDVWEYGGAHGVDYIQNHSIPEIDVCSFHLYPEWLHENTNEYGQQWIRDHVEDALGEIGKPVFLGEFGWAKGRSPDRPTVYGDWFDLVDQLDGTGAAAWQLVKEDRPEASKHDIRPSDTATTSILTDFASIQRSKDSASSGGSDTTDTSGTTGSSLAGERLIVEGAGADIWDRTDAFHFVHEKVSGDATLVARVDDQENTDPWAKAGLMIRDSLGADAAHGTVVVTPENGIAFQHRESTGGWMNHAGTSGDVPRRLKLERRGDAVTGYAEVDGSWVEVGNATISMSAPHLGLAVTSHETGVLSTVRFDVASGESESRASSWTNDDVGAVQVAGNARRVDSGTFTLLTDVATGIEESSATLHGELADLGGASSADVAFDYREPGVGSWTTSPARTLSETGLFSDTVSGLASGTTYEFRAAGTASDGRADTGSVVTFTTASAPSIDRYEVTEAGSANAAANILVEWDVSDPDGDLSAVVARVLDDGAVIGEERTEVSGDVAYGVDYFEIANAGGQSYEVEAVVTDTAGRTATMTSSLTVTN